MPLGPLAIRDRLLASPRFRRWAERFPLTRPVARGRARALFDLCAGFVYAQVLAACVQLDLFPLLAERPRTTAEIAAHAKLAPEAAERLLLAAVSLRLLARRRGRFALGPLGAAMVGNPGIAAMVAHHPLLYADLADPVALLRGERGATRLAGYWPYAAASGDPAALDPSHVAAYTALMAASQPMIADEVLAAYPVRRHRMLLDVGGGSGGFLIAAHARAPKLGLMLFDLPPVAEAARVRLAHAGVPAQVAGGDLRTGSLPQGADIVTLIRVVHDHDDATAVSILRAAHAALPPGGTLLVAEPMAGTRGAEPVGDAYFGFYLLAMGSGRARSPSDFRALLTRAGFTSARLLPTRMPLLVRVIAAQV